MGMRRLLTEQKIDHLLDLSRALIQRGHVIGCAQVKCVIARVVEAGHHKSRIGQRLCSVVMT